jgi:hypothetical protein
MCINNNLVLFGQDIKKKRERERMKERAVDGHLTDFLYSHTHISFPQGNERAYIEIILI